MNIAGINYPSKIDDWKMFFKKIRQLLLIFCILEKKKYVQLIPKKLFQIAKKKILLRIPNEEKEA